MVARPSVFISYSNHNLGWAVRVRKALRRDFRVQMDRHDLEAAGLNAAEMEKLVWNSDCVVLLLSPESVDSYWVSLETEMAFQREARERRQILFPAIVALCDVPPRIAIRNCVDLAKDFRHNIRLLTRAIKKSSSYHVREPTFIHSSIEFSEATCRYAQGLGMQLVARVEFVPVHPDENGRKRQVRRSSSEKQSFQRVIRIQTHVADKWSLYAPFIADYKGGLFCFYFPPGGLRTHRQRYALMKLKLDFRHYLEHESTLGREELEDELRRRPKRTPEGVAAKNLRVKLHLLSKRAIRILHAVLTPEPLSLHPDILVPTAKRLEYKIGRARAWVVYHTRKDAENFRRFAPGIKALQPGPYVLDPTTPTFYSGNLKTRELLESAIRALQVTATQDLRNKRAIYFPVRAIP